MSAFQRVFLWLATTAFRLFPWPTRPGLRAVGDPGPEAPVLLTANFALTVARVKRALQGEDAWLLVADSRGVNVWCAAAGGHLTTHEAVAVLKTSGIADKVTHRRVILPQLAATGIEADEVEERTGWRVAWGPVDARDLPAFLAETSPSPARAVRFDVGQRLEMAVMWAAPLSLLALVLLLLWPAGFLPAVALIWAISLTVYLAFPLYEGVMRLEGGLVPFASFTALFGLLALAAVVLWGRLSGQLTLVFLLRWGGIALGVVLLLAFDLAGSTPLYKSWTHEERRYRVRLDQERCIGCGRCAHVCPRAVFDVAGVASQIRPEQCEQCGACIVQCPVDALSFLTPDERSIPPEVVRRYKLNLMGQRKEL